MELVRRDRCVFSGHADLEHLYTFPKFPVYMGCVTTPPESDLLVDMSWHISQSTGSIQANPLIPLPILYPENHAEAVGTLWRDHHRQFAEFIAKFSPQRVFEIGGAHGILSKNFLELHPKAEWTILEPNPVPVDGVRAKFLRGFFDEKFTYGESFDAVVHSHVLEHIYQPLEFVRRLRDFVPEGKVHLFSIPNMRLALARGYTNVLDFEHSVFLPEPFLDALLVNSGFELLEKRYFGEHSIFYATRRTAKEQPLPFPSLHADNKKLFLEFIRFHEELVADLNKKIEQAREPVYLFGGHEFSQFLIAFGLRTERILGILDNGPQKIGKRLYGTRITVDSPQILRGLGPVNVILRAAQYNAEIKKDIHENINPEARFWE